MNNLLVDLPNYNYAPINLACPECFRPLQARPKGNADARCKDCQHSKLVLPVNYLRAPKRKDEDEEDEY